MKEAVFYEKINEKKLRCNLCPHHCVISPGKTGICRVRKNIDETLFSLVYNQPLTQSTDPIEKKPLFHFYPGSAAFSIATVGCNLRCLHCQNADISQAHPDRFPTSEVSAEKIVENAVNTGSKSIAYTYTEPTIFYEYAFDIATQAHKKDLKNVFVTNGYIEKDPIRRIAPILDAANIDLKAMSENFYQTVCGAHLQPVLDAIKEYYEQGVWIEITSLLIPGYNDDEKTLSKIADFIASIDSDIPWHVTGFHPTYKLTDTSPTPLSTLDKAVKIGKKTGLNYVYQGNRGIGENTYCPNCGKELISRSGFRVSKNISNKGICPECNTSIAGVHMQ